MLLIVPLPGQLAAQGLVVRDAINLSGHMVAYDTARQRLVEVGRQGETREFDGAQWLLRPGPGPRIGGSLCYRTAARRLCAFGMDGSAATWECDGTVWQRLQPPVQPPGRFQFACAYDSLRDRVVVFGGAGGGPILGDTWEWDGTTWTQRATGGPQARTHPALAFDSARGVCVLFGGQSSGVSYHSDTWEWNGTNWLQANPPAVPPARTECALAYDPVRAKTVLYGGIGIGGVLADLWEYDGATWRQVAFTGGPGQRWQHDMVFDSALGEVLVAAGATATAISGEVWQWNGARWRQQTATAPVPHGFGVAAAAEPLAGGVLMYGNGITAETWRFRQGTWTLLPSQFAPFPRAESAMWCDGANAWLFGGRNSSQNFYYTDTWRWTATGWQSLPLPVQPSPRALARVAYDAARGRAVLFGGYDPSMLRDTWTFDGVAWQRQTPAVSPPARCQHGLAFDPASLRVVLFGGTAAAGQLLDDTWEWDGSNWAAITTPVRPPAYGAPAMHWDGGRLLMTHAPYPGSAVPALVEAWRYDGTNWTPVPLSEPRVVSYVHALAQVPGTVSLLLVDGGSVLEFVPRPAQVLRQGTDCGPWSPQLAGRENPRPGNAEFGLDVVGAPPFALAALAGADASASLPLGPCTLLLAPPLTLWFAPANGAGFATQRIPVPSQPVLIGGQWFFQAAVLQPAVPAGFALSAALRVVVGD